MHPDDIEKAWNKYRLCQWAFDYSDSLGEQATDIVYDAFREVETLSEFEEEYKDQLKYYRTNRNLNR